MVERGFHTLSGATASLSASLSGSASSEVRTAGRASSGNLPDVLVGFGGLLRFRFCSSLGFPLRWRRRSRASRTLRTAQLHDRLELLRPHRLNRESRALLEQLHLR